MKKVKSLFEPLVDPSQFGETFRNMISEPSYAPGRRVADRIFGSMNDADGNFIEQFQSTGTDARAWELYLSALFSELEFAQNRLERPDFDLHKDGTRIFVEAMVSQKTSGTSGNDSVLELSLEERRLQEYPIKIGSPLYSK